MILFYKFQIAIEIVTKWFSLKKQGDKNMNIKMNFLIIACFLVFNACTSNTKQVEKKSQIQDRMTASDTEPVEPAELQGVIVGLGGESDIYFINDKKMRKVFLEHTDSKSYWEIRNNEGGMVSIWGTWDESQDKKSVFMVRKLTVLPAPVETTRLQGRIRGVGGESDIYFIIDKKIGKIFLEHRNSTAYEAIRNSLGKSVYILGTFDESEDKKHVFIVDSLSSVK